MLQFCRERHLYGKCLFSIQTATLAGVCQNGSHVGKMRKKFGMKFAIAIRVPIGWYDNC